MAILWIVILLQDIFVDFRKWVKESITRIKTGVKLVMLQNDKDSHREFDRKAKD